MAAREQAKTDSKIPPKRGGSGSADRPDVSADVQCIEAVLAGKTERFEELVERYKRPVYGIALSYVRDAHRAEDLSQEVFVKAFSNLKQLRATERFFPWLLQIARHRASREIRKVSRRPEVRLSEDNDPVAPEENLDAQRAAVILAMVEELADPYRQTILLKYQQGLSCKEIAAKEGVAIGTITSRLTRALVVLRSALGTEKKRS